ncbi:MAG: glycosyl hydrolase family 28-related protein [Planctomycetota bacterium]|nr:glycosyl hydrolase family 28-related protein [Planctomycetota bacterium]
MKLSSVAKPIVAIVLLCLSLGGAESEILRGSRPRDSFVDDGSPLLESLPDFSQVGYHQGRETRPKPKAQFNVQDFGAKRDDGIDDSVAIQKAIDKASQRGGVVVIPEGRWRLEKVLEIRRNNVILRGAGSGKTTLYSPVSLADIHGKSRSWSWSGGFIRVNPFRVPAIKMGIIEQAATAGTQTFTVKAQAKASPKKGEWLELQWHNDKGADTFLNHVYGGFIAKKRMGEELQKANGPRVREWVQISDIDGDQWTLSRPLLLDVRPEWRPTLVRCASIQEVGVEGFSIEFPKTKYPGHLKESGYNGLAMSLAVNCWVNDFKVVNGDSGLFMNSCAYVTATHITMTGRYMHHPISLSWSSHCLVRHWRIKAPHRHGTTLSWGAHGNVFSDGWGKNLAMDCHRALPFLNLHTKIVSEQGKESRVNPLRSGGSAPRGPHSGKGNIYWNVELKFNKKAPKTVRVSGHSQWPGGVFYSWRGNRKLDFRTVKGLGQRFPLLNRAPKIPNLYQAQRNPSQRQKKRPAY